VAISYEVSYQYRQLGGISYNGVMIFVHICFFKIPAYDGSVLYFLSFFYLLEHGKEFGAENRFSD
jgi:hypothetical protein